jgi:hypothetical protein
MVHFDAVGGRSMQGQEGWSLALLHLHGPTSYTEAKREEETEDCTQGLPGQIERMDHMSRPCCPGGGRAVMQPVISTKFEMEANEVAGTFDGG